MSFEQLRNLPYTSGLGGDGWQGAAGVRFVPLLTHSARVPGHLIHKQTISFCAKCRFNSMPAILEMHYKGEKNH